MTAFTIEFGYNFLSYYLYFYLIFMFEGYSTPQYSWFNTEIAKVNRSETPWLIVIMHPPWYNSNAAHYMEGQTMRVVYEKTFVQYKVDVVFAGHVHAYERSVSTLYTSI
jgi:3',5'-cyclic AMP phosphodiesterase CpdA